MANFIAKNILRKFLYDNDGFGLTLISVYILYLQFEPHPPHREKKKKMRVVAIILWIEIQVFRIFSTRWILLAHQIVDKISRSLVSNHPCKESWPKFFPWQMVCLVCKKPLSRQNCVYYCCKSYTISVTGL